MDIFLVRHGEAAASWSECPDPGLSERGAAQAAAASDTLLGLVGPGTTLISSPLARALETARPLAAALGTPVQEQEAFREIPSPVPLAERQGWLRRFMQQRWTQQPEELHRWRDRALEQLLVLERPAVVFTHFLVINAVVGHVEGREETLCFWPDNASITRLRRAGDALELVELGREMATVVN